MKAPIALALDVSSIDLAVKFTNLLSSEVEMFKIGLQTYLRDGNDGFKRIKEAAKESKIFLDLKLHDIPQTVSNAISSLKLLQPDIITVHALGGSEMLKSAVAAAGDIEVAAVTVLTSLRLEDVKTFSHMQIEDLVLSLSDQAISAGCSAIVCSPLEIAIIRKAFGNKVKLIVPGVRMPNDLIGDQARISTPAQAIADGANVLVIGRPILQATDPVAQVNSIKESLSVGI